MRRTLIPITLIIVLALATSASAGGNFVAHLSGASEVPPVETLG